MQAERINQNIIQSAVEAAERQKDKILPLDVPKTPQIPTSKSSTSGGSSSNANN